MNIVMIGTGYVGLSTGLGFASLGHKVACVDIDPQKISLLDRGQAPFYEPGISEMLKTQQELGHIVFTTDLSSVISSADVMMIAVQTPPQKNGEADLSFVYAVAEQIGRSLDHEAIVVIKSTVPAGTNRKILARIHEVLAESGRSDLQTLVSIASVPEFLRQGSALNDFLNPDRIVIGADDNVVFETIERLHEGLIAPIVRTTIESSELIKSAANAFLATKISFINEIANVCERTGADVREVARGIGLDPRIGHKFLKAGIGFGGSCFPKDVSSLKSLAGTHGYDFRLLRSVIEVNTKQREVFFQKIVDRFGSLKGRRMAVWGLAFKSDTDDTRDSIAIDFVRMLVGHGADVVAYDPKAMDNAKRVLPESVVYAPTAIDAADGADALVLLTEWPEFQDVSFATLLERMVSPIIFDGRNCLVDKHLPSHGFEYHGVGVCTSTKS